MTPLPPPKLAPIDIWHDLDYAAALYVAAQIELAGGMAFDAWEVARWYACDQRDQPVTRIYPTLCDIWIDATATDADRPGQVRELTGHR